MTRARPTPAARLQRENRALREELSRLRASLASSDDSCRQYASFMESTTALAWMKDEQLRLVYLNPACQRFRRMSATQSLGQRGARIFAPKTARMVEDHDRRVLNGGKAIIEEQTVPRADGSPSHWRVLRFPYTDRAGRRFVGGLALDISEYFGASHALKQANEQTAKILDHITDGFVSLDHEWRFSYINRHASEIIGRLGKPAPQLIGQCLWEEFADLRHTRLEQEFRRAASRHSPSAFEFYYPPLKGWFQLHIYPSEDGLVVYFNEITHRKEAEKTLRMVHGQVLAAQETERRRVARELHDGVNQLLSTAQFRMQGIESALKPGNGPLPRAIRGTARILERAVREVRRISQNLRPSELDHLGLGPAIQSACRAFRERTGIPVSFDSRRQRFPISPDRKLAVYRILQEALTNIEKHARARRVSVHWSSDSRALYFRITDDGCGFVPASTGHKRRSRRGFGLLNMRERSALAGGELHVTSAPNKGTKIEVWLPLPPP